MKVNAIQTFCVIIFVFLFKLKRAQNFSKCRTFYLINQILTIVSIIIEKQMANLRSNILLLIALAILQCSESSYFDFNEFINISPSTIGVIVKNNNQEISFGQGSTSGSGRFLQQTPNRFQLYYNQPNNNLRFDIKPIEYYRDPKFNDIANRSPDMKGVKTMYGLLGIPESNISGWYVPNLKRTLDQFDEFFGSPVASWGEELVLDRMISNVNYIRELTDWLTRTYLRDVNKIIVGSRNSATGKKIFISTDNMNVVGENAYVFNGNSVNNNVVGKNIMRTKRYEINFDLVNAIKYKEISRCIKIIA